MGRIFHISIIGALLFCVAHFSLSAQDSNFVRKHIVQLGSREMFGRGNCYGGELKAAEYIRKELAALHAMPLAENGFQKYSFKSHNMEGAVTFSINGKLLNPFDDYRIAPFSHSLHQQTPIIRVSAKILLSDDALENFRQKNKEVLYNSVVYIDAVHLQCKDENNIKQLQKAIRSLEYNNPFQSAGILIGVDALPVWGLSNNDYERNYALIYVKQDLIRKKIKTAYIDFTNDFITKQTQNVCFAFEGTTVPDSFVVLTAHYDHLGCMGDSVIFPGVHDNASGVAAVLDFARYFEQNPPAYTTVFLLFSGEESGLKGSNYFEKNPLFPFDKVKLLINLDMFCGGNDGIMVVNAQSENTKPFYDKMLIINEKNHFVTDVKQRPNAANSDHYPFSAHCPAIFIYVLGGRSGGYHNYTDTCANCSLDAYEGIFKLISSLISDLSL
ncbi:MAG: M28 family peptidase [Bacteroidales bacterium]|nr:M28 family peptidase [Bacteroidales bacterium]